MQSHLVLLLLVLSMALISAKNIRQIDVDNDVSEEQSEVFHLNHKYNQPHIFEEMLFKLLKNKDNLQQENDRYETIAKRAKAITKGDPREFMG